MVTGCVFEAGHGGVVLGSEMSGGIRDVVVSACAFRGTDRGIRVKTRRGGEVEGAVFSDLSMKGVHVPVAVNCYYGCGAWGNPVVSDKEGRPADAGTPGVGSLLFSAVQAGAPGTAPPSCTTCPSPPCGTSPFRTATSSWTRAGPRRASRRWGTACPTSCGPGSSPETSGTWSSDPFAFGASGAPPSISAIRFRLPGDEPRRLPLRPPGPRVRLNRSGRRASGSPSWAATWTCRIPIPPRAGGPSLGSSKPWSGLAPEGPAWWPPRASAPGGWRGRRTAPRPGTQRSKPRRIRTSAIWTALRAAPLRRLSETTQRLRPLGTVGSMRRRPT